MTCAFCSNPAQHVCAWPTVKGMEVSATRLKIGDIIFDQSGRKAEVMGVSEATFIIQPRYGALSTRRQSFSFSLLSSMVLMDLPAPCGAPACEAHEREVSEDRRYCADHWQAWEQVA